MENKIMMPASYNVLSCEEMTYTEGGATFTEALLNWIPPIGWYMGVTAMRNYRKSHPNDWLDTGLDALSRDMDSSAQNMLRDLGRIVWVSVPFGPLTVTTFGSATETSTPAGMVTGILPIRLIVQYPPYHTNARTSPPT